MSTQQGSSPPGSETGQSSTHPIINVFGHNIQRILYKETPVITLRMIDELHQRQDGTARHAFNRHKDQFIEGEDFFNLPYEEWSQINAVCQIYRDDKQMDDEEKSQINAVYQIHGDDKQRNNKIFLTQTGYLMLIKPFTDQYSWNVMRILVTSYFILKEIKKDHEIFEPESSLPSPPLPTPPPFPFPVIPEQYIESIDKTSNPAVYYEALLHSVGIGPKSSPSKPKNVSEESASAISSSSTTTKKESDLPKFRILACSEVANILGITSQMVSAWNQAGRFDGYKFGEEIKGNVFQITSKQLQLWAKKERLDELVKLPSEISLTAAAQFLGVSRSAIHRFIETNTIKSRKVNKNRLIKSESLINVMK